MDGIRLFLHIFAASIWVGGQVVMAGMVPAVRSLGEDAPGVMARAFNRIAWPAYGVAVLTGIWSLMVEMDDIDQAVFGMKFLLVVVSGVGAGLHIVAKGNKTMLAVGGATALLGAMGSMLAAVWLQPT